MVNFASLFLAGVTHLGLSILPAFLERVFSLPLLWLDSTMQRGSRRWGQWLEDGEENIAWSPFLPLGSSCSNSLAVAEWRWLIWLIVTSENNEETLIPALKQTTRNSTHSFVHSTNMYWALATWFVLPGILSI